MDTKIYYSVGNELVNEFKIKRSVFLCSLAPSASIHEAKEFISKISRENHNATHNCWAYIIGEKGAVFHSSDAGEPSGTAGLPILNALQSFDLSNTAAVVTRHFGGVKLGVRGLIEAYSSSVKETLKNAVLKPLIPATGIRIETGYAFNDILMNLLEQFIFQVVSTDYADTVTHTLEIKNEKLDKTMHLLSEYRSQGKVKFQVLS